MNKGYTVRHKQTFITPRMSCQDLIDFCKKDSVVDPRGPVGAGNDPIIKYFAMVPCSQRSPPVVSSSVLDPKAHCVEALDERVERRLQHRSRC